MGIVSTLTIVFVILKLANIITWSWWWVLAPLWIGGLIGLAVIIFGLLVWLIFTLFAK